MNHIITRAQEQSRINQLYVDRKITREQWLIETDLLGNADIWCALGKNSEITSYKRNEKYNREKAGSLS